MRRPGSALRRARALAMSAAAAGVALTLATPPAIAASPSPTVVTWASSADRVGAAAPDLTYRSLIHTSVGGHGLRVRLSNALGEQPVTFGHVYVATRGSGAPGSVTGANRPLTFGGSPSVTVAPGTYALSDPLPGTVRPQADLAVSVYVREASGTATGHGMAMQTSYIAAGDHAADSTATAFTQQTGAWFYLDAVTVDAPRGTGALVALGDSITDGWHSTSDANRRWPDYLARRLLPDPGSTLKGVANEGISGNQVIADDAGQSALHRLDRDVLSQKGLRTVLLAEGVNDIKSVAHPTAEQVIAGYREIVQRAHARGVCVVGATIMPFKGWPEWTPEVETVRRTINAYVRDSGLFDATVDFDRALRSPYDSERMYPQFDDGDHIHPNDKGMQVMADTVSLPALNCDRG